MSLESEIWDLAEGLLGEPSHFLVDVKVSLSGNKSKVLVLLDGDEGITIDECASLSRLLGNELEERELLPGAYMLEVSSPGISYPLKTIRQFRKNIDRQLKVKLREAGEKKGRLAAVKESSIVLEVQGGKGKNKVQEEIEIPLDDIEKATVQISFK